jgi:alpha-galactosidase
MPLSQSIQRWTGLLLPPELVGAHVSGPVAHTTHRAVALSLRLVTALFGHAGIEWDITSCTPEESERLRKWALLYKELRGLIHSGATLRSDDVGDGALLHGVVGDGEAVYAWVRLATGGDGVPPRFVLPGLDPARRWRVTRRPEVGEPAWGPGRQPPWLAKGVELAGSVLTGVGLPAPHLQPQQAVLLHAVAVSEILE